MNVERLRPVILSILDVEMDREQTADMIIRVIGGAEAPVLPQPSVPHRSREVRLSAQRTRPAEVANNAAADPQRPLAAEDYYTAAEIAQHLGIGVESAYSLLQREPDAFPYQVVTNTGRGPKSRKVYLGRSIIQYIARRGKGHVVEMRPKGADTAVDTA